MRDLYNNVKMTQPLNPAVATTTKTSSAIDRQGYGSLTVLFSLGTAGDTLSGSIYWTLKLTHSDDDASYSDVAVADLVSATSATAVIDDLTKDETVVAFGYKGAKRYIKAVATPTGSHATGTPIGVVALRGTPSQRPVS